MRPILSNLARHDVRPGTPGFYGLVLALMAVAYALTLIATFGMGPLKLATTVAASIIPLALLGAALRTLLLRWIFALPAKAQAATHVGLGIVFTMLWYWLVIVLLGVIGGGNVLEFVVRPFRGLAQTWHLVQGLLAYLLVATAAYAETLVAMALPAGVVPSDVGDGPFRLFVRQDDDIRPLDPARILFARGADDYAEVVTPSATHLVRLTLATLADRLGAGFIRVHRSVLVNVDQIARAEPAGNGRMLLHMENGAMITTSRAGARVLRERII